MVSDSNGGTINANQSFSLTPVNDAPVVSGRVNLGAIDEGNKLIISTDQLLFKASDVDGDSLSVTDVQVIKGQGSITDNGNGTYTFNPIQDWDGKVRLAYNINDDNGGTIKVKAKLLVNPVKDEVNTSDGESDIETIEASVTYTISSNIENLTLTGSSDFDAKGNSLDNTLTGNDGNNTIDGGLGQDSMSGGDGNDTYIVDSKDDRIKEKSGKGTDLIYSKVTYTASANVENLSLIGSTNINGSGNSLDNTLIGNTGDNKLYGKSGDDKLYGGSGKDSLYLSLIHI